MKKFFLYIPAILLILKIQVLFVGCANIIPPEGGYRDSIPPMLVKASPADSSKNFESNRITLNFDEFVELQNVRENLIVSPVPTTDPIVESRLRTVTVRLKDTLEPNTTYSLNFGKAIKDVNEGNIARNYTYLFSTGSTFDSLTLSGKVILAENGKVDTTLVVMLHKNADDSAVVNERPRYLTRLDSSGKFTFRNLPEGSFYIYALQDEGGGHRYLSDKQLFAFADTPVAVQAIDKPVTLYAYAEEKSSSRTLPKITPKAKSGGGASDKRLRLQTNLANGQLDLLNDLIISFEQPLVKLDTSLMQFSSDTLFTPLSNYRILADTTKKKLSFQHAWKENTQYNIILDKNFAEDTLGRALLKTDTISFRTKKLSDYGSLRIRFKNFDLTVNPVLQFVQNNEIVRSVPLTAPEISQSVFLPGEYELRILYDRNKNEKWDPGEFFGQHLQPEIVKPVSRRIIIKANWANDFDVAL